MAEFVGMRLLALLSLLAVPACDVAGPPLVPALVPISAVPPPLAWESGHPKRAAWSRELRAGLTAELGRLDAAGDASSFCPPFAGLQPADKVEVLATLAVGVALFESGYDPSQRYREPMGYDSVGLFQLSYEDRFAWCTMDPVTRSLEDPLTNIRCAVPEMARLVSRDRTLAGGSTNADARGLARYWSVVRRGPAHKLAEITAITRRHPACS